jgi:hypothetical protein
MNFRNWSVPVLIAVLQTSPALAQSVTVLRDTILSSNATAVKSYDTNVNIASYRQQGILYYSGYQYVSWYNGNTRNVVVARRSFDQSTLNAGTWAWAYINFNLESSADSHNVISIAVSPNDGRLHVAIGTHGGQLYTLRTVANAVKGTVWNNTVFGGTGSTNATAAIPLTGLPGYSAATANVTYPYLMNAGDSAKTLQLAYRTGSSGNGVLHLAEYNASTGNWSYLGQFTSASGNYVQNGVTSTTRNAYPHGLTYDYSGRLHMAFTWRENLSTYFISGCTATISNHDTLYAYSDDKGRTWKNGAGVKVAITGTSDLLALGDAGLIVDSLAVGRDLMNQETQIMDRNNLFHAFISYVPGRYQPSCATDRSVAQPFHVWRSASGIWTKVEVKLLGADVNQGYDRSKVFFGKSNNLYLVLPDLRIVGASATTNWTDWKLLYDGRSLGNYGESIIDYNLTRLVNGVSIVYLKNPTGTTGELHVLDLSTSG